jgi:uncharacterized membrane protein
MAVLIIGLVVFLGVHSIALAGPTFRSRAIARMGEGPWKGLYALVAAVGFVLICYGFHLARESPLVLYSPPGWMRYVTFLLMLPVFPLVIAAYLPGRIKAAMKHPLLAAVKFWALAHLLANGMLADVLLFGGFLVWAGVDRMSLKRRVQAVPAAAAGRFNDLIAVVVGLALYLFFIEWAHLRLFGVSPLYSG